MNTKVFFAVAAATLAFSFAAKAQTNLQFFYDFGKDRNYVTTTLEGFYTDKIGDTFFFIDLYYSNQKNVYGASNGAYFEIERSFNFWHDTAMKDFSILVEYDGATWGQSIFDFGPKYSFHNDDFSRYINLYLCYDVMFGQSATVPIKLSGAWAVKNLFGVERLTFNGFFDFWGLDSVYADGATSKWTFLTEPQLWFKVQDHIDVGTEIELSYNFAGHKGFMCNPCLGFRWRF